MKKNYHFVGIGGIGMSAIARILLTKGEKVTGSDIQQSKMLETLKKEGAEIYIGHSKKNIKKPHAVIYSSDIPKDNIELLAAKESGIPVVHRSELLAELMEGYTPILVTGTHGKTTTSSLLSHLLLEANLDPSFAVGGIIRSFGSNFRYGRGVYFVIEADESDGTFLHYPSFGAIITNIELDHMDFWKTEESLIKGFSQFATQVGSLDHLFWCKDDLRLFHLKLPGNSYGFDSSADLCIQNFQQKGWGMVFDLSFEGKKYKKVEIPLIGAHNILNASAAFGLCLKLDLPEEVLRAGLSNFKGIGRRLEVVGKTNEITIYDDYAHHPTEIYSTLRALKTLLPRNRLVVAFQPHRFSRTRDCLDDFPEAFDCADVLILTDIYPANEKPIPGITAQKIYQKFQDQGYKQIYYAQKEILVEFLEDFLKPTDVLITMGAGDITHVGLAVLRALEK